MTKQDVVKIFAIIAAAYSRDTSFAAANMQMVNVWTEMLKDCPYEVVEPAIRAHIATSPFPPTISDIRGWAAKKALNALDSNEAWGKVMEAVRKCGYYRECEAAELMGADVYKVFKQLFNWQDFCMSENNMADRAHFSRAWDNFSHKAHEQLILPDEEHYRLSAAPDAKQLIQHT